jgi:hypothetical protein
VGSENRSGQYEFSPDPDLNNIITVWARKIGLAIRTTTLGTVQAYNPTTQEASVMVDMLKIQRVTQQTVPGVDPNETNEVAAAAPTLLTNVPVLTLGAGNGTSYLTFPILPGCTGALVVLDRSKDTWMNRTAAIPVDPVKSAIHSLADCFFIPGLTDKLHRVSTPTSLTAAVLESTLIKIGAGATSNVVKSELLDALDAFANAVPVPNDGGAALQTAFKAVYTIIRPMLATTKTTVE